MTASTAPAAPDLARPSAPSLSLPVILLIVILYAAAIYLPFLGSGRTLTRHEMDVVQPARTMLETGNWLVPHYEGIAWVHKPPLLTWLTAPVFAVAGGFNEFVARLPAALCAIALCVLMTVLAWRFYDPTTALFAGLVQASTVYLYTQGRLAESDILLMLLVAGAHGALAWHWRTGRMDLPLASAALFHTLIGLAILTKGPMAIIFSGMTVLSFCAVRRSIQPLRAVLLTPAVLCSLVIGFWWYVAITFALGDSALGHWNYSYFQRFAGGYHMGYKNPLYYFYTIPWLVLPATLALVIGAKRLLKDLRRPDAYLDRFLWCWFLGGLLFLTISVFKHKHYSFPILPPLTLLAARILTVHVVLAGRRARTFYLIVFLATLVVYNVIGGYVMPRRDHRRPTVEFVQAAVPQVPDHANLYVAGLAQAAVYPYIKHPCVYLRDESAVLAALAEQPENPMWVLTYRKHLGFIPEHDLRFEEIAAEPPHAHHPTPDTLVLGRVHFEQTHPAQTPTTPPSQGRAGGG